MDPRPGWIEAAAEGARTVALGMLRGRGRGAVPVGVARVDAALEALPFSRSWSSGFQGSHSLETTQETTRKPTSFG